MDYDYQGLILPENTKIPKRGKFMKNCKNDYNTPFRIACRKGAVHIIRDSAEVSRDLF